VAAPGTWRSRLRDELEGSGAAASGWCVSHNGDCWLPAAEASEPAAFPAYSLRRLLEDKGWAVAEEAECRGAMVVPVAGPPDLYEEAPPIASGGAAGEGGGP
jgi:hypothetical protein